MTSALPAEARALILQQVIADGASPRAIERAAKLVGRSPRTIRRWVALGAVPANKRLRYEASERDLDAVFDSRGILRKAFEARLAESDGMPSRRSWERAVHRAMRPDELAFARDGVKGRRAHTTYLRWEPEHRNEVWEADHKELDVWVVPARGHKVVKPWITAYIDGATRAIMGYALTLYPNTAAVLAALRQAVLIDESMGPFGGAPDRVRYDNGRDWLSNDFGDALQALGVLAVPVTPYAPHEKGKIERVFGTLRTDFLSQLPSYVGGPRRADGTLYDSKANALTLDALSLQLQEWVHRYNVDRPHDALGGSTPLERWTSDTIPLRVIAPELLHWMLMPAESRKVNKDGIHFRGITYFAAAINGLVGENVDVRYTPNDPRCIEVFRDGRWLATAVPSDTLSADERKDALARRADDRKRMDVRRRKASRVERLRIKPVVGEGEVIDVRVIRRSTESSMAAIRSSERLKRVASTELLDLE